MLLQYKYIETSLGKILLGSIEGNLCYCGFADNKSALEKRWPSFTHQETTSDINADTFHLEGTPFQQEVWKELLNIPYGTTTYYEAVAERINRPKAVRAVASAIGSNPIAIFIPCHRVISKTGAVHKYAYGTKRKEALLELEASNPADSVQALFGSVFLIG